MTRFLPLPDPAAGEGDLCARDRLFLERIHRYLPVVLYCSSYQDGRWTIRYVSEEIRPALGYRPEEVIDRRSWRDMSPGSDKFYEAIPKTGRQSRRYHQIMKFRCADGEIKTFSDDGVFLYDEDGHLTGSVGAYVDITIQKEAQEAMALEYRRLRNLIRRPITLFGMVGNSPAMQEVFTRIIKLAVSNASVVVTGESGTGKELAARAIHELSNRTEKPFVAVNCGAVSDGLFESEFFGHVKGAFTGAVNERKGYLGLADGGTMFLDEVGEISPGLQAKLLRALDGYGYLPVGGSVVKTSKFRLIAATNRDLETMVRDGTMRKDFYFRIKTFHLALPPLRERPEDIPLLAHHFMERLSPSRRQTLSLDVLERLSAYSWPGNIRELQSVIYRYATFQELGLEEPRLPAPEARDRLRSALDLAAEPPVPEFSVPAPALAKPAVPASPPASPGPNRADMVKALEAAFWNVSLAAEHLGLSRATMYRYLKRWNLQRPRPEKWPGPE